MTAQTSIHGRLVADPQSIQTKSGTPMTSARLAVELICKDDPEGKATWWLGILAFGRQAELLAGHQRGDMLSASGSLQMNRWTGKDGQQHESHQLVADALISARTVRPGRMPGSSQRSQAQPTSQPAHQAQAIPPTYDDDLPPFDDKLDF